MDSKTRNLPSYFLTIPYTKKEPRLLLVTETGAGAARYSAPARLPREQCLFHNPGPTAMGRGSLLHVVRRREQYQSQCGKQGENKPPHGRILSWLAPRQA